MKKFSADLQALLDSGVPVDCVDLFAIGPCQNGAMIYATNGQLSVAYGGNIYQPVQYGAWSRGTITTKIGLESNSCDLTVLADNQVPVYFPGTSSAALLIDGIKYGLLGNAGVTISTLYNSSYLAGYACPAVTGPTGGSLAETEFVGQVADIGRIGLTKATVTVQDMLYLLNIQIPRRVFQASCSHTVYDAGCALSSAAFTRAGVVAATTSSNFIQSSAHIEPVSTSGTFEQGVLTWTSGKNSGLSCAVRAWTPDSLCDSIQFDVPPLLPVSPGDTFQVREGCNKTFTSCANLQGATNAYVNFGGQPTVPVPETAIGGGE